MGKAPFSEFFLPSEQLCNISCNRSDGDGDEEDCNKAFDKCIDSYLDYPIPEYANHRTCL